MAHIVSGDDYPIGEGTVHLELFVPDGGTFLCPRASRELLDNTVDGIASVAFYNDRMIRERLACPWCVEQVPLRAV